MSFKSLLAYLALFVFVFVLLECFALGSFYVIEKQMFSYTEMEAAKGALLKEQSDDAEQALFKLPAVIHPYVGMVNNPDSWRPNPHHMGMSISQYGYFDDKSAVQKKSDDTLVVGVFGGSVAWWLSALGQEPLKKALKKHPQFSNKKVKLVRTALGASKQPQQLMTFAYLLSLGAHFDLIINLDGFNEIAIPATHNLAKGVYPFYPSYWYEIFSDYSSAGEKALIGQTYYLESERKRFAALAAKAPYKYSVAVNVLWSLYDRYLTAELNSARLAFKEKQGDTKVPFLLRGPGFKATDDSSTYEAFAAMWKESSRLMHAMAAERGIPYFHFLQPNQYHPGSKELSEEEKKKAYDEKLYWREQVLQGYPHLIAMGKELKAEGVSFFDLTQVFVDHKEPLYHDSCCHLNPQGNALLAERIAEKVLETLSTASASQN